MVLVYQRWSLLLLWSKFGPLGLYSAAGAGILCFLWNSATSGYCSRVAFLLSYGFAPCFANGCLTWPARFGVKNFGQQGLGKSMIGDFCNRQNIGPVFTGPALVGRGHVCSG